MRFLLGTLWLGVLAAVGGSLAVLIGVVGGSLHWSFDLAAQFLLPSIVAAGAAALVAVACRWPRLALAAAGVTLGAYLTATPFTSPPASAAKEAPRFKVLLFNIWVWNNRLPEVREMVERANADIVVLVETTERSRDKLQALSSLYPYRFDCVGNGECDITILARSRLSAPAVKATSDPEESPVVNVETEVAGCRMKLFATHMTRPFPNRPFWAQRAQAEEIGNDVGAWPGAKLLLGDFNGATWGHIVRTIEQRGGVRVLTGEGGTWPSLFPPQMRIPIDHMMVGRGLSFVSRQVLPRIGSDHAPVLAEIAVTDPSQCG
jgi:endonuclease/exonuclease/phosphatase (EEP) superfamily protein YafD